MSAECPMCRGTGTVSLFDFANHLDNKPGAVGRAHPETSVKAARRPSNIPRFGSQRWQALYILQNAGPMTCAELADRLSKSRNQTATRLGECREVGLVEWCRDENGNIVTRPTGPNDEGRVQRITLAGRMALAATRTAA